MDMIGYFGKIPAARDFVFHGLPTRVTDQWARLVSPWIAAMKSEGDPHWQRSVLTSPVWRFLLPHGLRPDSGAACCAGLMAGSIDGVGRVFPFAVLMAITDAPGQAAPDAALDLVLDGIESDMLAFMEGQFDGAEFAARLARESEGFSLAHGGPGAASPVLIDGEQAVCLIGTRPAWSAAHCEAAYGLRAGATAPGETKEGYWWHDGDGAGRPPQLCIIGGLPHGAAAQPFFHPHWHAGWHPRAVPGHHQI